MITSLRGNVQANQNNVRNNAQSAPNFKAHGEFKIVCNKIGQVSMLSEAGKHTTTIQGDTYKFGTSHPMERSLLGILLNELKEDLMGNKIKKIDTPEGQNGKFFSYKDNIIRLGTEKREYVDERSNLRRFDESPIIEIKQHPDKKELMSLETYIHKNKSNETEDTVFMQIHNALDTIV